MRRGCKHFFSVTDYNFHKSASVSPIDGLTSSTFSSWASFPLAKIGCTSWLIFLERSVSCLLTQSADFWSLNGNTTRTGFSFGVSHNCCRSVDLLNLLKDYYFLGTSVSGTLFLVYFMSSSLNKVYCYCYCLLFCVKMFRS